EHCISSNIRLFQNARRKTSEKPTHQYDEEKIPHPLDINIPEERQSYIRKKFDYRLLPVVCILYALSYVDRSEACSTCARSPSSNIGNAKKAGLDTDLHLDSHQWSWVLYSFYICYIVFEWSTILWTLLPAHIYIAYSWGVAAMCTGEVQTFPQLIACRCILALLEAIFGCGAPCFLSLFYQRRELGSRMSILPGMSPVANCFASALSYGISLIKGSLRPWRYIFLIVVFYCLPDSPGTARFLTESEQTEAVEGIHTLDRTAKNRLDWRQVSSGLTDSKNYSMRKAWPHLHNLLLFYVVSLHLWYSTDAGIVGSSSSFQLWSALQAI
ncbi:hypothetical protein N7488_012459, partial [Penicillium malachiteum]